MKKLLLLAVLFIPAAAAFAWLVQGSKLFINGSVASNAVIERDGVAYVPVKDVAAALHLNVSKTARGYELVEAGGANQVGGVTGKIGDVLFNGFVRFQVVKVEHAKSYTRQYSGDNHDPVTPFQASNELLIVTCKLKNGIQRSATPNLTRDDSAVTDANGHSYSARRTSDAPGMNDLLPGASAEFALIFDIPEGAKIQELVYQPELVAIPGSDKKRFRVSLTEG